MVVHENGATLLHVLNADYLLILLAPFGASKSWLAESANAYKFSPYLVESTVNDIILF